jgi:hypothetical protein
MDKEKIIESIAHSMVVYDEGSGQKTWRELATVAYYAYQNCVARESK